MAIRRCNTKLLATTIVLYSICSFLLYLSYGGASVETTKRGDGYIPHQEQQQHELQNPNDDNNRGHLWIHMGPPKTATSTLQTELGYLEGALNQDGYTYVGKFLFLGIEDTKKNSFKRDLISTSCHKQLATIREHEMNNNKHNSIRERLIQVSCWKTVLDHLQNLRSQGLKNVIVSDELLGYTNAWHRWPGMVHWSPLDWISFKLTLETFYNIHIVVGYRRYFEWAISAKIHQSRWKQSKTAYNSWPILQAKKGGKSLQSMMNPISPTNDIPFLFTDEIVKMVRPFFLPENIHILDMHKISDINKNKTMSIRTNFLCHVLLDVHHACSHSLHKDQQSPEQKFNEQKEITIVEAWYDILVTIAAEKQLFSIKGLQRRQVALEAQRYHIRLLNTTMAYLDLPRKCPSLHEVQFLLNVTLQKERNILGSKNNTRATQKVFANYLHNNKLCQFDVERALVDDKWRVFFSSLG